MEQSTYRWTVLGIVMLGTLMAILDSSIVNVALPHMMSAFGVTRDSIEWVSTAFMLASAVAMPLVGWLAMKMNYKMLYLGSLLIFTLGSAACAFAWSYEALIVARIIQAVGGGAIQPIGMAMVADLFEPHERGRALGIWGTGIMVGPALGPTLGGYLTEWFGWRSIFSVNLPLGALTLALGLMMMRSEKREGKGPAFDFLGFGFLSLFLIAGLLGVSNGQEKGWDSAYIIVCWILATIGIVMFIAVEMAVKEPLLDLKLFKYRNYTMSMLLAVVRSVGLFGGVFLLPIFLENLVGYTTIQTGLWMMPGALAMAVFMPIAGRLSDRFQPRWLVVFGSVVAGLSLIMYGNLDPRTSASGIIVPQLVRGLGLALMMAPVMTAALNAVPRKDVATASSFLNISQRVGGAFGIAVLNSFVTNRTFEHLVHLAQQIPTESAKAAHLGLALSKLGLQGQTAMSVVLGGLAKRAQILGFDNGFVFGGLVMLLIGVPIALLLGPEEKFKKGGPPKGAMAPRPAEGSTPDEVAEDLGMAAGAEA